MLLSALQQYKLIVGHLKTTSPMRKNPELGSQASDS